MGRVVAHEFMSFDGVFEDPRWTFDFPFDPRMGETIAALMGKSKAILLGRKTYEMFAPAWSGRTADDDPGAPFMNESPKYVVSSTLQSAEWQNSTIVGPYDPDRIRSVKESVDGDIYLSGSGTLVRALIADGLLDELHVFLFPVVLGSGQRLFPDAGPKTMLELAGTGSYESGAVHLGYRLP